MKKLRYLSLIILVLMLALTGTQAFAECDEVSANYWVCSGTFLATDESFRDADEFIVITAGTTYPGYTITGGGGSDTLINDGYFYGTLSGENGSDGITDGNDTLINNGSMVNCPLHCNASMSGYFGNDTLINNGLLEGPILGGIGADIIVNTGTMYGNVWGNGFTSPAQLCEEIESNNIITSSGMIGGTIYAGCLNDTITLEPGANGGSDNYLLIDGEAGEDTLVLSFDTAAVDAAVLANASSGTITIDGQTFEWINFEHIVKGTPADGRLNGRIADNARTAAVYCSENEEAGGVTVYGINDEGEGYLLFSVSAEDAHAALELTQSSGEHVLIAEEDGQSLWALTSNELQIHDANGEYDFIFEPTVCGVAPAG